MEGFDSVAALPRTAPGAPWDPVPVGYLDACSMGLPLASTLAAMRDGLAAWGEGRASAAAYAAVVERSRALFARIVGVPTARVSIGATASDLVAPIAASLPDGSAVLCAEGDFSSIVYPFMQHGDRGVAVAHAPLESLADAIRPGTALVSFSLVQSADGRIADVEAILAAAHDAGALVLCDLTQAAGAYPVDAARFDFTVCHTYKWLCAPRGVAFLTSAPEAAARVVPLAAGWYAGERIWESCYGPEMRLAADARRFDSSPAWLSWVGAEPALEHFARADIRASSARCVGLADGLLGLLGLEPRGQYIVALDDPDGERAAALDASGVRFARRAGRVRLGFHAWNTEDDVDLVAAALAPLRRPRVA